MDFLFFGAGLLTGAIGTLVGAGGGFILSPLFLFLFPDMAPARLTALSLFAVAANSTSGTIGYISQKQIHWKSVAAYSAAALPGVFIGVKLSHVLSRQHYEIFFSIFLVLLSVFVFYRSRKQKNEKTLKTEFWNKTNIVVGIFVSFFVGIIASLLGIGGGIIHVPLMSQIMGYPIHLAAGTSHAILALSSLAAVLSHYNAGDLNNLESFVPYMAVGLVIGAQIGSVYSKKISGSAINKVLSLALFLVALRLIIRNWLT